MSSRQLKKLRAQEERAAQKSALGGDNGHGDGSDNANEENDEDEESEVETRPRPKNVFAAFAALGDEGDNDEDEDEDEKDDNEEAAPKEDSDDARAAPKPSKKKKKKKKKGKGGKADGGGEAAPGKAAAAAAASSTQAEPAEDLDEIDRALQELRLKEKDGAKGGSVGTTTASSYDTSRGIKVNFSDLRVLNELREVFGRDIVQAAAADDALGVPGRPRGEAAEGNPNVVMMDLESFLRAPPPPPRGMVYVGANGQRLPTSGGMAGMVAKRNPFIQWKDTWPRGTSGGLVMRQLTDPKKEKAAGGIIEYTYVHSPAYVHLEDAFFTLVMMHNPQPLIQFLREHPFHIASLIQISRVAKLQDQNASLAADLCERALFSFGRSTLSSFRQKLAEGRARLSFYRPENRQFLLAGYHYIRSLIARGTYRTALAWTKLFISLMPNDEYALVLYAQSLAVRAFEARWLISYLGKDDDAQVPALRNNPMRDYIRQSLVPALLQLKDVEGARAALAKGMTQLPWLYGTIFQTLGLDVPRAVWGIPPRDENETLYTQLYVHLTKELWDVPQARSLLQEVADSLSTQPKVDASSLPPASPVTLSIARFVYLDSTPALMALVPKDMLHAAPNYDFDPLPPPREQNEFHNPSQVRPWIMAESDRVHGGHNHMPVLPDDFLMPGQLIEVEEAEDFDHDHDPDFDEDLDEDDYDDGFDDEIYIQEDDGDDDDEETGGREEPVNTPADAPASSASPAGPTQHQGGMPGAWFDDDE